MSYKLILVLLCCSFLLGCSDNKNQIVEYSEVIPYYYVNHLKEKEKLINDAIQLSSGNCASFIFFTDVHWGNNFQRSPALIKHIVDHTPVKEVFFGGDVITTFFDDPSEAIELGKSFRHSLDIIDCNKYFIYGNHDNNSDYQPDLISRHIPENQVFEYLQKNMSPCAYFDYYNFYVDMDSIRTRIICPDTGRYYYSSFRNNTIKTIQFIIEALNTTPSGWYIVFISHIWSDINIENKQDGVYKPGISTYFQSYLRVLDDYKLGRKGVFSYGSDSVEYDFSNSSSHIICCIGGHNHIDTLINTPEGIPIIINTTDSRQTLNGEMAIEGTITEQSLSAFIIDYNNSIITRIRVGRGQDITLDIH